MRSLINKHNCESVTAFKACVESSLPPLLLSHYAIMGNRVTKELAVHVFRGAFEGAISFHALYHVLRYGFLRKEKMNPLLLPKKSARWSHASVGVFFVTDFLHSLVMNQGCDSLAHHLVSFLTVLLTQTTGLWFRLQICVSLNMFIGVWFSAHEVAKILGLNWLRVLSARMLILVILFQRNPLHCRLLWVALFYVRRYIRRYGWMSREVLVGLWNMVMLLVLMYLDNFAWIGWALREIRVAQSVGFP